MNLLIRLALVAVAACLCLSEGAPDNRLLRSKQRPTRGFKTLEMMTARGFGKRDRPSTRTERDVHHNPSERSSRGTPTFKSPNVGIARDYGKRSSEDIEDEDMFTQGQRRLPVALLLAQSNGKRDSDAADNPGDNEYLSKRGFKPNANVLVARGYGKRDKEEVFGEENFLDTLESSPQKDRADSDEKPFESVPVEWFVNEMLNNQEFARSVVRKFIDVNQDGMLSNEELLRNPA